MLAVEDQRALAVGRELPELAGRTGGRVEVALRVVGEVPDVFDVGIEPRGRHRIGRVGQVDDLAGRTGPDENVAVGQDVHRKGLRIGGVVGEGPGCAFLGLTTEDLALVAGRGIDRAVRLTGQIPDACAFDFVDGGERLAKPNPAVFGDNDLFAMPLHEGRGRFLPPGLELAEGEG